MQRAPSKPLYIKKMVKKRGGRPKKSFFSKNEKIVKNYQREDPKKTKISKKISDVRSDVRTDVRTDEYSDDNTPSGVNSAG